MLNSFIYFIHTTQILTWLAVLRVSGKSHNLLSGGSGIPNVI